jgi:ABC-type multidrug transport system ATPase subunit
MELQIRNLSKTYPNGVEALKDVTLTIPTGMYGLLGPNGAGKSTLMRTLATLQEPDTGEVTLGAPGASVDVLRQPDAVRRRLGYLPQEFGLYPKVPAYDLLDHFATLKGVANKGERKELVEALLHQTNLWNARTKHLGGYSGGMRQRFGIAVALIGDPDLIIVDEPTAGLDPAERVRFLNLLSELGEGAVVILSTHIVEDVAELCSRMAIINAGRILLETGPLEATAALEGTIWKRIIEKGELEAAEAEHAVISSRLLVGKVVVHVYSPDRPGPGFEPVAPDLEDVYFSTMKGHLHAGAIPGAAGPTPEPPAPEPLAEPPASRPAVESHP